MPNDSVKAFQDRLARLPAALRKAAAEAVKDEAEKMAALMRRAVPVGKTGKLQASIRVEPGKNEMQALIKAGGPTTTVAARGGHGKYDYAMGTEFGTRNEPAKSFFWPSYRLRKKQARAAISRKGRKAVKDAFGS